MSTLPKSYMKVARDITGYWGTYLPSLQLAPGMVGRTVGGVFIQDGTLEAYPGYRPDLHAPDKPQPQRNPVSVWRTKSVEMTLVSADGSVPAAEASGRIRLRFAAANEAVILCNGTRRRGLANLPAVKSLMWDLRNDGNWDAELCLVTEVLDVKAAWICFATDRDQVAEINGGASIGLTAEPAAALDAATASGKISASWSNQKSAGFYAEVSAGGTPLFQAIRFRRDMFGLGPAKLEFLKGQNKAFEEPSFGEPEA